MPFNCFANHAKKIRNWLDKQPEAKEESLTDWLLYSLSEESTAIRYRQFNRTEESRKTGADWEWWFVFPNGRSFAARIQAKKLKPHKDCYPAIAYCPNGKLQIERLLEDCEVNGMAAFYVFYSTEDLQHIKCQTRGNYRNEGVFFAEANLLRKEVIEGGRKKLMPKDVLAFANYLSCLFCCPIGYSKAGSVEGEFRQYLEYYFPTYSENANGESNDNGIGFRETPNYILELLNNDRVTEEWVLAHDAQFERVNGVLVIDLRNFSIGSEQTMNGSFDSALSKLYLSFFNCLLQSYSDDQNLRMAVAILEQDIVSYIRALKSGAELGTTNEDLFEKYSKVAECREKWEAINTFLRQK